jgi:hydrogenase nickel incorporation protein HypA/HybF
MHELSIAIALVDAAATKAEELGAKVTGVHVRIGALSGVVADALAFSYEVATADTPLAGTRLQIEEVPAAVECATCGGGPRRVDPQELACPGCGQPAPLVAGRELELYALEVDG